jgi:hypothetical protein
VEARRARGLVGFFASIIAKIWEQNAAFSSLQFYQHAEHHFRMGKRRGAEAAGALQIESPWERQIDCWRFVPFAILCKSMH